MTEPHDWKAEWNKRFSESPEKWASPEPFLAEAYEQWVAPRFPAGGRALDLAGGLGRHGLWVAERGWTVDLWDLSDFAVAGANAKARERGVNLRARAVELLEEPLPENSWDLILVFNFLVRPLFAPIAAALKPGGVLIYKSYTMPQLHMEGGPTNPDVLLEEGELGAAFPQLKTLFYREVIAERAIAQLVAEKQ